MVKQILSLNSLIHRGDFDLATDALGVIRCGPFGASDFTSIDPLARDPAVDGVTVARAILVKIAHHLTGNEDIDKYCGGPQVSGVEVEQISRSELDKFCYEFAARRLKRRVADTDSSAQESVIASPGCDTIAQAIANFNDANTEMMRATLQNALRPVGAFNTGGGIGGPRAADALIPQPMLQPTPFQFPENPIVKTNQLLTKQLQHLRDEADRAAIEGVADRKTAAKSLQATVYNLRWAVGGIVLTAFLTLFVWYDGKLSAKEASKQAEQSAAQAAKTDQQIAELRAQVRLLMDSNRTDQKAAQPSPVGKAKKATMPLVK